MRTNPKFIHEFDDFESILTVVESADRSVNEAYANCIKVERKVKYGAMFENTDYSYMIEEAKKGLFTTIGEAIENLIKKVIDTVTKFFNNLKGNQKENKDIISEAQKAVKENPSLKDEVVEGLSEGKYNINDLGQLQKDYEEATKLLEEGKIDTKTFKGKCQAFIKKFQNQPKIVVAIGNVAGVISIAATLMTVFSKTQKESTSLCNAVNAAKQRFHKVLSKRDENGQYETVLGAFYDASKLVLNANAVEGARRNALFEKINGVLKRIVNRRSNPQRAEARAQRHAEAAKQTQSNYANIKAFENRIKTLKEQQKNYPEDSEEWSKIQREIESLEYKLHEMDKVTYSDLDRFDDSNRKTEDELSKKRKEAADQMKAAKDMKDLADYELAQAKSMKDRADKKFADAKSMKDRADKELSNAKNLRAKTSDIIKSNSIKNISKQLSNINSAIDALEKFKNGLVLERKKIEQEITSLGNVSPNTPGANLKKKQEDMIKDLDDKINNADNELTQLRKDKNRLERVQNKNSN